MCQKENLPFGKVATKSPTPSGRVPGISTNNNCSSSSGTEIFTVFLSTAFPVPFSKCLGEVNNDDPVLAEAKETDKGQSSNTLLIG